jgi:hypothetical protein
MLMASNLNAAGRREIKTREMKKREIHGTHTHLKPR